ncbi:hypothetical protein N0V93_000134 [Gnomoniopsis smithogilvyi]|uniref:Rhodopsin domain-containing protein n=1 Tax=Gnomoniopsis smithogilvyi TaxID=1191159 RepID=A0A9W8Z1C1_9PEZI|nr:hypothetical protein N0V93_000134 [Gnomoniopsis smithogilvyi]
MLDDAMFCLADNCTMEDTMRYIGGAAFLVAIVVFSTLIRIGGKFATKRHGVDDIFIVFCFILIMTTFTIFITNSTKGLGKHTWDIADTQTVVNILKLVFAVKVNVPIALTLTKIAIVFFYMGIFRSARSRIAAWTLVGFLTLTGLANILVRLLECDPVAYSWDKNITSGMCHSNLVTHGLSVSISVLQDICIIAFPAFHVGRLQMRKKQKVMVIAIFTLGGLGCLAGIVRLVQVIKEPVTIDLTWDNAKPELLAGLELTICYMGACLPMLTACLSSFFPKYFGNSTRSATLEPSKMPGSLSDQVARNLQSKSQSHATRRASLQPMELSLMRAGHSDGDWDRIPSPPLTPKSTYQGHASKSGLDRGDPIDEDY